jgi:hypothetical protein
METPHKMTTLSEVLNKLRHKGIDKDFIWKNGAFTLNDQNSFKPQDLTIVKVFRFEGMTDPSDMSVIYLVEANDGSMGYIVDSYGVYSTHDEDGFDNAVRLIPEKDHDEQLKFEL